MSFAAAADVRGADVVIVGGGIMGCAVSLELAGRGARVVVLERSLPGAEASTAAAGILAPQVEADGPGPLLALGLASRALYPALAARLKDETGIDVGYRACGTLALAFDDGAADELRGRRRWQSAAGLHAEWLDPAALALRAPAVTADLRGALWLPDDHQVDPRPLMRALSSAAERAGVRFVCGVPVGRVAVSEGRVAGIELAEGTISARTVVLAAGSWSSLVGGTGLPADLVIPVRGQMVALDGRRRLLDQVVFGPAGYVVPRADGRVLAGSTMEMVGFDRTVTAAGTYAILGAALRLVPGLGALEVAGTWASFRPRTPDDLPLLGRTAVAGLFVATGHHRNGILLAPITAAIVAAEIAGHVPPVDAA
ncbi:MAG TPA: glycine oxidase ThiO, partial [Myxococcota bacterium]|nr:glycine oxidase ThiO [Myxococcota bacterium]